MTVRAELQRLVTRPTEAGLVRCSTQTSARSVGAVLYAAMGTAVVLRLSLIAAAILATGSTSWIWAPDTASYVRPAYALLQGGFQSAGKPELVRTPGYPLFLAVGIAMHHLAIVSLVAQIILSGLAVWLVYAIALELFESRSVANWAAIAYAIEPLSIVFSVQLLTETLFSCFILGAVFFLVRYLKHGSAGALAASTGCAAFSVYVRPVSYYFFAVLGISALVAHWRSIRRAAQALLIIGLIWVTIIAPWQIRNHRVSGYTGFSAIKAINLYFYSAAAVQASEEHKSYLAVQQARGYPDVESYLAAHPEQRAWSDAQRYEFMERDAERTIRQALLLYTKIHMRGIVGSLIHPGAAEYTRLFGQQPSGLISDVVNGGIVPALGPVEHGSPVVFVWTLVLGAMLALYYATAMIGIAVAPHTRTTLAIGLVVLYLISIAGGAGAMARFRHPVMPFVCIFSAAGIEAAWNLLDSNRKRWRVPQS